MPNKTDSIAINDHFLKRSCKLLPCQKESIVRLHGEGFSIHSLSKMFQISRRSIQFILYPERLEKNKELREDRGGSKIYYDRETHNDAIRRHRQYKKELFIKPKN